MSHRNGTFVGDTYVIDLPAFSSDIVPTTLSFCCRYILFIICIGTVNGLMGLINCLLKSSYGWLVKKKKLILPLSSLQSFIQANASSGMAVHDECKLKFLELKAKRNYRFIVFKIEEKIQQVIVEKLGSPEETYDDFAASMPENECRYAVFDFDFTTPENCQKSKIFFVAW